MSNKILHWNCWGIRANYEELLLLNKFNLKVVCLQETFLKDENQLNMKHFQSYNYLYKDGHIASGGVSILIRKDIHQSQVHVDTDFQAIVVKATLHKPFHICSIYIPPHDPISDIKMNELLQQIPKPYLLLGDLNSHSTVWGWQKTIIKGNDLEKVMQNNNLCILNNKSHTYLNSFTGSYSTTDLTLCDPESYMDYWWKVHHDLCGSDHFAILIEILQPLHEEILPHWKLNKANLEVFETLNKQKLFQDTNSTDQTNYSTDTLISIANICIAKLSTSNKHKTPWFNDDCRKAIRLRKAALRKFNKQPTSTNLNDFNLLRAKTRKLIKEAKKKSWQNYVN